MPFPPGPALEHNPITGSHLSDCALTVDGIAFDPQDRVLFIRRANPPFARQFALPGGFVDIGESVEAGCRREFLEETGLETGELHFVGVYSDPSRDPRGHTVSIAYLTRIDGRAPKAGSDAAAAQWVAESDRLTLAFDHETILRDAQKRLIELGL